MKHESIARIKSVAAIMIVAGALAGCGGESGGGGGGGGAPVCLDADADGFFSGPGCGTALDCDDTRAEVHPGAPELCDGLDNQCPGDPFYGTVDAACMAPIPAGCFNMGDAFSEGYPNELPVHIVCLTAPFLMDVHETTNAEYAACVAAGACAAPALSSSITRPAYYGNNAYNNHPVLYVTRDQAEAYCAFAGKRLPTEAQWEYAARGGLAGKRYPTGDDLACDQACFARGDAARTCWNYAGLDNDTHAVESYPVNGYGLHDMDGNALEWVADRYLDGYYSISPVNDPAGPPVGDDAVLRGGSWYGGETGQRAAARSPRPPTFRNQTIGFRCVRSP